MDLLEGEREAILNHVDQTLKNYELESTNLLPILQETQHRLGYIPKLAMEKISKALNIPAVDVFAPVTFFNQFRLNPPGEHELKICMGTACYMVGGKIAMESFERRLKIKEGETTPNREFSLERVACVGCCTMAPVVVVDGQVEGHVTPTRVDGILLSFDYNNQAEKEEEENSKEEGSPS